MYQIYRLVLIAFYRYELQVWWREDDVSLNLRHFVDIVALSCELIFFFVSEIITDNDCILILILNWLWRINLSLMIEHIEEIFKSTLLLWRLFRKVFAKACKLSYNRSKALNLTFNFFEESVYTVNLNYFSIGLWTFKLLKLIRRCLVIFGDLIMRVCVVMIRLHY